RDADPKARRRRPRGAVASPRPRDVIDRPLANRDIDKMLIRLATHVTPKPHHPKPSSTIASPLPTWIPPKSQIKIRNESVNAPARSAEPRRRSKGSAPTST